MGLGVISLIGVNVEGFWVVTGPGIEGLPVLQLLGQGETELGCLPTWGFRPGSHCSIRGDRDCLGK